MVAHSDTFTHNDIAHFTGSENFYRIPMYPGVVITDGVHYILERVGWIITDILAVCRMHPKVRYEDFVMITFQRSVDKKTATITYDDGNGKVLYVQTYGTTVFPLDHVEFYFENNTMMLPSER